MKVYLVGGAVRDKLLGLVPRDTDYLVIGSTAEEMKAKGFLPVGESFPIFLHPITKEEYSLSSALNFDLERRDLTMNAMALDQDGKLFDPFGGERDLKHKVIRHVKRENFYTDPLRVLRAARFKAQFPEFSIDPETLMLMLEVSQTQEFAKILPERVIKEVERSFDTISPSLFFKTLKTVNALSVHFFELSNKNLDELDRVSLKFKNPVMQFAALVSDISLEQLETMGKRLQLQNAWLEAGRARILYQALVQDWTAHHVLDFLYQIDAFRKPGLIELLTLMELKHSEELARSFNEANAVSIKDIATGNTGKGIGEAIRRERLIRLQRFIIDF